MKEGRYWRLLRIVLRPTYCRGLTRCPETTRNGRVGASSVPNVGFFLELWVHLLLNLLLVSLGCILFPTILMEIMEKHADRDASNISRGKN